MCLLKDKIVDSQNFGKQSGGLLALGKAEEETPMITATEGKHPASWCMWVNSQNMGKEGTHSFHENKEGILSQCEDKMLTPQPLKKLKSRLCHLSR